MHLQKHPIYPRSHRSPRQHRNKLRVPAAHPIPRRRRLHRVRPVEDHRRKPAHDRQRTHIHHQVVVPEARTPLRQADPLIARVPHLLHRMLHIRWSNKLTLLDVHRPTRPGRRNQQIRLPTEKRRNLQHRFHPAQRLRESLTVLRRMHIRQHRQPRILRKPRQDPSPLHQPRTTKAVDRRSVRLIVARLENIRHLQLRGDPKHRLRHLPRMRLRLQNTRPSNQKQLSIAHTHRPDSKRGRRHDHSYSC